MPRTLADISKSVVLVIDVQPNFMKAVFESDRVVDRTQFLVHCAQVLGVSIVGTEQNPERMGGLSESIHQRLSEPAASKMSFSCSGCEMFRRNFRSGDLRQVVLVGVETHICVTQTSIELLDLGHEVIVCGDAVSSRTEDRHRIGLERLSSAGATIAHSESIVYEWMRTAEHPRFRDVLKVVKAYS